MQHVLTALFSMAAAVCLIPPVSAAALFAHIDEFEIPKAMKLSLVGDAMRINGVETQIYSFEAHLEPDAIADHFANQWPRQMRRAKAGPWDVLSHRQDEHLVTVQITNAGIGATRGFIAASNIFEVTRRNARPEKIQVPLLSGTQVLQDIASTDYGRNSRTLVLVSDQSAAQNLDWYRNHFRSVGFAPITGGSLRTEPDGGAMVLNRDGEQLNLSAAESAGRTVVTIVQVQP